MSDRFLRPLVIAIGITVGAGVIALILYGLTAIHRDEASGEANAVRWRQTNPDAVACRAKGGFPVYSRWDGQMTECRPLVKPQ